NRTTRHDHGRAIRLQRGYAPSLVERKRGQPLELRAGAVATEHVPVHTLAVVLLRAEIERGEGRDGRGHADPVLRLELREQRACPLDARVRVVAVPLGEAHRAHRQAGAEAAEYEFGRAAADVDEERRGSELADAPPGQLRLLVAREQLGCKA